MIINSNSKRSLPQGGDLLEYPRTVAVLPAHTSIILETLYLALRMPFLRITKDTPYGRAFNIFLWCFPQDHFACRLIPGHRNAKLCRDQLQWEHTRIGQEWNADIFPRHLPVHQYNGGITGFNGYGIPAIRERPYRKSMISVFRIRIRLFSLHFDPEGFKNASIRYIQLAFTIAEEP